LSRENEPAKTRDEPAKPGTNPASRRLVSAPGTPSARLLGVKSYRVFSGICSTPRCVSFHQDFRRTPPCSHMLYVCRAESCQSAGCERLVEHLENRLRIKIGNTTPDQSFHFLPIYCLGNCAHSPAVMLDGKPYGGVTPEMADLLIDDVRRRLT
jgi:NADH:ubiquinone oxidoreductase subunit E